MDPDEQLRLMTAADEVDRTSYDSRMEGYRASQEEVLQAQQEAEEEEQRQAAEDAARKEEANRSILDVNIIPPFLRGEGARDFIPAEERKDVGDYAKGMGYDPDVIRDRLSVPGIATVDFGMDAVSTLVPPLGPLDDAYDAATADLFQDPAAKAARGPLSVIIPSFGLGAAVTAGAKTLQAPSLVKGLKALGYNALGSGAIGYVSDESETEETISNKIQDYFGLKTPFVIEDGDSPTIRRIKTGADEVGLSIFGDVLGAAFTLGKPLLKWFSPKNDVAQKVASEVSETFIDADTASAVANIDARIAGDTSLSKAEISELTKIRDNYLTQARTVGYSDATEVPMNSLVEQAQDSRQIQLDTEAIEKLSREVEAGPMSFGPSVPKYDPVIQSDLASEATVARQAQPPLVAARQQLDYALNKTGVDVGGTAQPLTKNMLDKVVGPNGTPTRELVDAVNDQAQLTGDWETYWGQFRFTQRERMQEAIRGFGEIMNITDPKDLDFIFKDQNLYRINAGGDFVEFLNDWNADAVGLAIKPVAIQIRQLMDPNVNLTSLRLQDGIARDIQTISETMMKNPEIGDKDTLVNSLFNKLEFLLKEYAKAKSVPGLMLQNRKLAQRYQAFMQADNLAFKFTAEEVDELLDISNRAEAISNVKNAQIDELMTSFRNADTKDLLPLIDAFMRSDGDITNIRAMMDWAAGQLDPRSLIVSPKNRNGARQMTLGATDAATFFYGNILSIPSVIKAGLGATLGTTFRSLSKLVPATATSLKRGDLTELQATFLAVNSIYENNARSLKFAISQYKRAQADPSNVMAVARKRDSYLEGLRDRSMIDRAGEIWMQDPLKNFGQATLYQINRGIFNIGQTRTFRGVNSGLSAVDSFIAANQAIQEARYAAFMTVTENGKLPLDVEKFRKASQNVYDSFFDNNGQITNEMVRVATGELALNLDTPLGRIISKTTNSYPILRTLLPFPNTSANDLYSSLSWSPVPAVKDLGGKYSAVLWAKTPEQVKDAMALHGVTEQQMLSEDIFAMHGRLKGEYATRMWIGSALGASLYGYAMDGGITAGGAGSADHRRRLRKDNYPFYSIRMPNGRFINYQAFPQPAKGIFTILGTMAEGSDILGAEINRNHLEKLGFVFTSTLSEGVGLQALQPYVDLIIGGDGNISIERIASQLARGWVPQGGNLGAFENMINDAVMEVQGDVLESVGARLPFISDAIGDTPDVYTGNPTRVTMSPVLRLLNGITGVNIYDNPEPWRATLNEIGWSAQKKYETDPGTGFQTPNSFRREILQRMGDGINGRKMWRDIEVVLKRKSNQDIIKRVIALREAGATDLQVRLEGTDLFNELDGIQKRYEDHAIAGLQRDNADYAALVQNVQTMNNARQGNYSNMDLSKDLVAEQNRLKEVLNFK